VVNDVLALLADRRFICIDGPAGSGKSTLAESLGAPVVHLDDLYEGWTGLEAGLRSAQAMLDAFGAGEPAGYRRYDWLRDEYAEWVEVPPSELLVIEGCGAGSLKADALLVWIEASPEECLRRGLARDGEAMRDHWLRWQATEAELFARDRTHERAELSLTTQEP
jgi:cytidylate kinase